MYKNFTNKGLYVPYFFKKIVDDYVYFYYIKYDYY